MPLEREPQTGRNLPIQGKAQILPNSSSYSTGQEEEGDGYRYTFSSAPSHFPQLLPASPSLAHTGTEQGGISYSPGRQFCGSIDFFPPRGTTHLVSAGVKLCCDFISPSTQAVALTASLLTGGQRAVPGESQPSRGNTDPIDFETEKTQAASDRLQGRKTEDAQGKAICSSSEAQKSAAKQILLLC